MGSGSIAPYIPNLGTRWMEVSGYLHGPAALPPGKETRPRHRLDRRLPDAYPLTLKYRATEHGVRCGTDPECWEG
jgi:hypothetical protein